MSIGEVRRCGGTAAAIGLIEAYHTADRVQSGTLRRDADDHDAGKASPEPARRYDSDPGGPSVRLAAHRRSFRLGLTLTPDGRRDSVPSVWGDGVFVMPIEKWSDEIWVVELAGDPGFTDDVVAGKSVDDEVVTSIVADADLAVAQNAYLGRPMVERHWSCFAQKPDLIGGGEHDDQKRPYDETAEG